MSQVVAISPVGEAGGAENFVLDVLRQLQRRGHDVCLLAAGPGPLVSLACERGVDAESLPRLDLGSPRAAAACARALRASLPRESRASILLSHPKAHLLAMLSGVTRGRPSLLQVYDAAVSDNSIDRVSARLPVRRAAISERTAAAYAAAARPHRSQVEEGRFVLPVVRPAVDLDAVRRRAEVGDADAAMARAGLRSGRLDLVMVARLQRFKGPEAFVRLAVDLTARDPQSRSMLIGPDSPTEPGLRAHLEEQVRAAGADGAVALSGYVSSEDLAALVARGRMLVHPADGETFGLVLVEAMCVGTPVLAYSSEGPDEVLAHGGGVLVGHRDERGLAEAAITLLGDATHLDRLSAEARQAAERFDAGGLGPAYESLLQLEVPPPRP